MLSRLRVPTVSGHARHGATPLPSGLSRTTGRAPKISPGERTPGVSAAETRYNMTTRHGTIECAAVAFYQLIAGFPNRRKDPTMILMHARAP